MKSMESMQEDLISTFLDLGDGFNQYSYLIDVSTRLPPMPKEMKNDDTYVGGCQSDVWMHVAKDSLDRIHIKADSDAFILRGILYILYLIFENRHSSEVASFSFTLIDETALKDIFSSSRRSGITRIVSALQKVAQERTGV